MYEQSFSIIQESKNQDSDANEKTFNIIFWKRNKSNLINPLLNQIMEIKIEIGKRTC